MLVPPAAVQRLSARRRRDRAAGTALLERLRVADSLTKLEEMRDALRSGALAWSVVRELSRVAVPETEREWLEAASGKTARDAQQLVSGRRPGQGPGDPADPRLRRYGMHQDLGAGAWAIWRETLRFLRKHVDPNMTEEQALVERARRTPGAKRDEGRALYQIALTRCEDCHRVWQDANGEPVEVPAEVLERASCDAQHIGHVDGRISPITVRINAPGASTLTECGDTIPISPTRRGRGRGSALRRSVVSTTESWRRLAGRHGINHPGSGGPADFSGVRTSWSATDGDTWQNWQAVPSAYDLTTDPTTDFAEDGSAYVVLEAANIGPTCDENTSRADDAVLLYRTSDGTYPNPPQQVDQVELPEHHLDHPFMAIYRDPLGNADRLHVVWADNTTDELYYSSMPIGGALDGPHVLWATDAAPYLTVGAGGAVYVVGDARVCRIDGSTFAGCADEPQQLPSNLAPVDSRVRLNDGTPHMIKPGGYSLVASPLDPNVVCWAVVRPEGDNDLPPSAELDVVFSTGQYTANTSAPDLPFDWSPPVWLGGHKDDDADQFAPSIAVTQRGASAPLISVMYHDRTGGACDGVPNRCFRVRRVASVNNGATFLSEQTIPVDPTNSLSDPSELPVTCLGDLSEKHFLGHYRIARGDRFHVRHIITGSPNGGAFPEAVLRAGWVSGGYYSW